MLVDENSNVELPKMIVNNEAHGTSFLSVKYTGSAGWCFQVIILYN